MTGLAVNKFRSAMASLSSFGRELSGVPDCSLVSNSSRYCLRASALGFALASFCNLGRRPSIVWMSAKISSVLIISISCFGSIGASSCRMMSSFSNSRTTCTIASHSRMLCRNLFPKPSPVDAPATRPAISTNVTVAGMIFCV